MTLGVVLPYWLYRPSSEALDIGRAADRLGFDELWVGEMLTFDGFALAAALAATTARIPIVVGPLAVGVRDPVALALGLSSVTMAGSRQAHLALGASSPMVVEQWHDRPWGPPVGQMHATVGALRALLAGERHRGFRLRDPQPEARLTVAAFGPRMIAAAAERADRVVVNLLSPEQVARVRAALDEAAVAAGRPEPPPLAVWVPACLDPGEAAMAQLTRQLVAYCAPPGYGEMFIQSGFGSVVTLARSGARPAEVQAAIPPAMVESIAALGGVGDLRRRIAAYRDAGAAAVGIVPVTAEDPGGERLLAALAS